MSKNTLTDRSKNPTKTQLDGVWWKERAGNTRQAELQEEEEHHGKDEDQSEGLLKSSHSETPPIKYSPFRVAIICTNAWWSGIPRPTIKRKYRGVVLRAGRVSGPYRWGGPCRNARLYVSEFITSFFMRQWIWVKCNISVTLGANNVTKHMM